MGVDRCDVGVGGERRKGREMKNPILFLDVDGVLNRSSVGCTPMVPELVQMLYWVCIHTGCLIVVSSGWRFGGIGRGSDFHKALSRIPGGGEILSRVIGRTGSSDLGRAVEIVTWLAENHPGAHFAVVDDMDMTERFGDRQVLTSPIAGLTEERADALIAALETKCSP